MTNSTTISRKDLAELQRLLAAGHDLNAPDAQGLTPLIQAITAGNDAIVQWLIEHGASVTTADRNGITPLHFAAQHFQPGIADQLLKHGAPVDMPDRQGNTPLWRATFDSRGRPELIQRLLEAGADPDRKNIHGVSPRNLTQSVGNYDLMNRQK